MTETTTTPTTIPKHTTPAKAIPAPARMSIGAALARTLLERPITNSPAQPSERLTLSTLPPYGHLYIIKRDGARGRGYPIDQSELWIGR
jgi:hypothetical protein